MVRQERQQEAESLAGIMIMGSADIGVSVADEEATPGLGSFFQSSAKLVLREQDLWLRLETGKVSRQLGCKLLTSILGLILRAGLADVLPNILALNNFVQMIPGCLRCWAPVNLIFATPFLSLGHRNPAGFLLSKVQGKLYKEVYNNRQVSPV